MSDFERQEEDRVRVAEEDRRLKTFEQVYMQMVEQRQRSMRTYIDEETGMPMRSPRDNLTPRGTGGITPSGSGLTPRSYYQSKGASGTTPRAQYRTGGVLTPRDTV